MQIKKEEEEVEEVENSLRDCYHQCFVCALLSLFSELLDLLTSWCPGVQFCNVFKIYLYILKSEH